ncbi:MAG: DUF1599 domain-containing protein [Chitinophagales bacterium]|nr:DUF1599 domain-containing protein [Chitinophagales bacterium]
MNSNTLEQYDEVVEKCRNIFQNKISDYGTSWRIMRPSSITDQLFIKALRVRTIEEAGYSKIDEGPEEEFMGLINYCVIGLIQLEMGTEDEEDLDLETSLHYYNKHITENKELMIAKNHDYGEAWRDMRISSMTDMILMKIKRIKQIEDNSGKTKISEGIDSHYRDIINYSVFALIKLLEENN